MREIVTLDYKSAMEFVMPRHYAGRKPQVSMTFSWKVDGRIVAVSTFGKPASHFLCDGIAGKKHSASVYELNRLCRVDDLELQLSCFVSGCLRALRPRDWIVVSYADTGMNHHGYVYQACNFIYTGCTKKRTDPQGSNGKHARHEMCEGGLRIGNRIVRTSKHRYVYVCASNRRVRKEMTEALLYPSLPYPKGENRYYKEGFVYEPEVVFVPNMDIVQV